MGLRRGSGVDRDPDGVDISGQQAAECVVYQAVPSHGAQALEAGRRDADVEVAAAIPGPDMPGVQMALISHFQHLGIQCRAEATLDHGDSVSRRPGRQGSTWTNGFTWTATHTPDST